MSQNYKADSSIYPYIDDENKAVQFSTVTFANSNNTPGSKPNPSIYFGTAPAEYLGISYIGVSFNVTVDAGVELEVSFNDPITDYRSNTSGFGFGSPFSNSTTSGVWGDENPAIYNWTWGAGASANRFRGYYADWGRYYEGNTTLGNMNRFNTCRFVPMVKPSRNCIMIQPHIYVRRSMPSQAAVYANPNVLHQWLADVATPTVSDYINNVNNVRVNYPLLWRCFCDIKYSENPGQPRSGSAWFVYDCDFTPGSMLYPINPETNQLKGNPPNSEQVNPIPPWSGGTCQTPIANNFTLFDGVSYFTSGSAVSNSNMWFCVPGNTSKHVYSMLYYKDGNNLRFWFGSHCSSSVTELLKALDNIGMNFCIGTDNDVQNGDIITNPTIYMPVVDPATGEPTGVSNNPEEKEQTQEYMDETGNDDIQPTFDPDNPNPGGGGGGGGGDDGTQSDDGSPDDPDVENIQENVPEIEPDEITLSSAGSFYRSYICDKEDLQLFSSYLWNSNDRDFTDILNDLVMAGQNRLNAVIDVVQFPFDVSEKTGDSTDVQIRIGRLPTGIAAKKLEHNLTTLNLGSMTFHGAYKNFLDVEPYTKAWLYIPYCGIVSVSATQFLNRVCTVKMHVDLTTGSAVAVVYSRSPDNEDGDGVPILYKNCVVGMELPVTGEQTGALAQKYIGTASNAVSAIAAGSAGNWLGVAQNVINAGVNWLSNSTAPLETSGAASPFCSMLTPQQCYLIVERPRLITGDSQTMYGGNLQQYPGLIGQGCYKSGRVKNFRGFSKFANVKLTVNQATEPEKKQIVSMLEQGIFI